MTEVGRDHGLMVHIGARTDDGLLIVHLWPSSDGSRAAAADPRRRDVIQEHGLSPDRMRHAHHDVANYVLFEWPASPALASVAEGG